MKTYDTIVRIRSIRHEISKEYGHNTKALLNHYRELEKKFLGKKYPVEVFY